MSALRSYLTLFLLAFFFAGATADGQNITKIEYFFDADPGFGKGNTVSVSPATDVTANFSVDIASLSFGFHNLYVRGYMPPYTVTEAGKPVTKGGWSLTNVRNFYKESFSAGGNNALSPIVAGEYFVDTDPGFGKGAGISLSQGIDLTNVSFAVDVTALTKGFHNLHVRFRDAKGAWSHTNIRSFYKESFSGTSSALADITRGEYYIDTDPGFGKGKAISVSPGKDLSNVTFTVDITAMATGFHQLYSRFQDANGIWSLTASRTFYKETISSSTPGTLAKITGGEYFFDQDPGFGKGRAVSVTQSTDINNLTFTADITSLPKGFHQLYVRFKDANGVWSQTNTRSFYKETVSGTSGTLAKVVRLEYFVDTDPGFGKGTRVAMTPSLNDSLSFLMDMTSVTVGNHKVYVRAQDEQGVWSLVSYGDFKINPPSDLIIKLGALSNTVCAGAKYAVPYSVNGPFGSNNIFTAQLSDANGNFGNPTNIGTLAKSTGDTIQATIPAGIGAGATYRIRVIASSPLDTSGASDPVAIRRVPEAYSVINGATPVCLGQTTYSVSQVDAAATVYNWSVSGGGSLDTTRGTSVKVNWTTAGVYNVKVTAANACGNGAEKSLSVRVYAGKPLYTPTITFNGSVLSVTRTPSVDSVSAYKWYKDSVAIPNATSSSYNATQDGKYTVSYTNPCGEGPMSNVIQFIANKLAQTITFTQVADKTYGQASYVLLNATASSGLPVTFGLLQGSGTIKGDTLYITTAGLFKVRAAQAGNMTYAPATADMNFEVKKAAATITFSNLTQVFNGNARQPAVTTNPASFAVSLTYNGATTAPVNAGTYKVVATINNSNYQGADSASFVIQKASQTITLAKVPDLPLTTTSYKIQATASSNLPVGLSLSVSPAGSAVLSADTIYTKGVGTGYLTVTQAGNANYNPAPTIRDTFEIRKAVQSINFPAIADKTWGTAPFALNATASSGLAVSYRIVSGPATVAGGTLTITGTGTVVVEASQAGNTIYNAASPVQRSFVVAAYPDLYVQTVTSDKNLLGPGESVTVSWKVSNTGSGSAPVKWTERIYMQAAGGANRTTILLNNVNSATPLDTGKILNRSLTVVLPSSLNIGDQGYFVVELVPDTSVKEQAGNLANNTAVQATAWNIKKVLSLDLSVSQLNEGAAGGVAAMISRSGSLAGALTVNVTAKYPQRFSFTTPVTIPAGQAGTSFTLTAPENAVVEGTLLDTIQVAATGFAPARAPLSLLDNDQASLTITNLATPVNEGDSVRFKINTNLASASPLAVYLTSGNSKKLPLPASVVIPAGSTSANVAVLLAQNTTPEIDQAIEVKAGAANHNPATASVTVKDDDLPNLELVLQTNTISEGAGLYATQATLRRTSGSNPVAFTANLSASLPNTLILPSGIGLSANENEKTFTVGVIDNTLAEGQRQVAITASVFVNSCGCTAPPASSGSVTANLTVNDNDGPALTLTVTPLTLPEGVSNAGSLRITRNSSTAASLTVNLSTSDSSEATLPATATIAAGQTYVDVPITTLNDGVTDGSQTVYFGAKATGFATGSVWAMVTDQNKPDLVIATVNLSDTSVQAMNLFNYNVGIRNTGFATAPSGVVVHGYLSKDEMIDATDTLLTVDTLAAPVPVGQTVPLLNAIMAPNKPGRYKLLYKVNPESTMTELLPSNNTARAVPLNIKPDYTATAIVPLAYYIKGGPVPVSGTATRSDGLPAGNEVVEVYVITNGLRRTVQATTDAKGKYATQFLPMANEAGHYTVGASFPGLGATDTQDEFDILGVRINNGEIAKFKVILNDSLQGSLEVKNMSNAALTNFTLSPVKLPGGATIQFGTLASLAGNAIASLSYKVKGGALSAGTNFEVANFQAMGNAVAVQTADVFYFCQAPQAYVVADVTKINASVSKTKGERLVEFRLTNKGLGLTGNIAIQLPNAGWMTSMTPLTLPSLAQGDTAVVVLKFLATEDVPFDYPINGNIGIRTQNGNSFQLPFTFEKVAESKGAARITVTDQFTYYAAGEPKVAGALVKIQNYFSGEVYAQGYTDTAGIFSAGAVPEGRHRVVVEKEKHLPYNGTIVVEPGDTVKTTIFINYQAITFSWDVVPTAVQDQYDVTLVTKFETHVPVPVVTINMPKTMPSLTGSNVYAFNVVLTNHGLITAKDVALNLPNSDPEYEFVTNYTPSDLLAQQSIQVPVIMRRRAGSGTGRIGGPSVAQISEFLGMSKAQYSAVADAPMGCQDFTGVVYWYKCSLSSGLWEKGGTLFTYEGRTCTGGPGGDGGGGILIGGGGLGGNGFPACAICPDPSIFEGDKNWTYPFKNEKKSCVQCLNELAQAILGCLGIDLPTPLKCAADTYADKGGPKEYAECLISETVSAMGDAVVDKLTDGLGKKIPYLSQLLCLKDLLAALASCLASAEERQAGFAGGSTQRTAADGYTSVLKEIQQNLLSVNTAYTMKANWLNEYFGELSANGSWSQFSALVFPYITNTTSIPDSVQQSILQKMDGYDMPRGDMQAFFLRWNTSVTARNNNVLSPNSQYPNIIDWAKVKLWSDSLVDAHNYAVSKGFSTVEKMNQETRASLDTIIDGQKNAVCASVTVQFSQQLTMTREAFRGTLDIFNGHPTDKMDSITVNILITDKNGVPSNGLFQINTESLSNLSDVTGTGGILAQQHGMVMFLFIPTINAAPTVPVNYNFGGSVTYWDPYVKAKVTMPLNPVVLTVNPSPNLMLHYFMQRNILGDDPFTSPAIEPSVPAELSVMVENQGYGPAVNMNISSAQPKVIENEKGLAINFTLIGSNFQGQPTKFGVTDINFGTVPALQTRIGQWFFTSSLLGKFVSYEASVVHANSFGKPDLSLVKGVKLHELTKSVKVYGGADDGINDFLANDIFDVNDVPDVLYYSQGMKTAKVTQATSGSFNAGVGAPTFTNTLTVTASEVGWNYIKLPDPGNGQYELVSVKRSDNQVIPLNNAWLTFVTLPVSRAPIYENKFHFVDSFATKAAVTYTVVWKPKNTELPTVVKITGVPESVTAEQVKTLTVVFDKPIDAATFGREDLTLTFQGGANLIDPTVTITRVDSVTFNIDLSKLTTGNGFYAFTVQAAGVKDVFGISGAAGRQVTWTQFLNVPTVQEFRGLPAGNLASSFDTIRVLFNMPIDVASVTPQRFTITKGGVAQSGSVVIDSVSADKKLFYLSGLGSILTTSGEYLFTVDLPQIKSTTNVSGTAPQSVKLVVDKNGPLLVSISKVDSGGLDPQHIPFVRLQFNEGVVGLNTSVLTLTRNGQPLPVTYDMLSMTNSKNWLAGNFGMLTYPDGAYTLTINLAAVKDSVGNSGTGTQSLSWTANRTSLITVSNLQVSPDLGNSGSDGITSGDTFTATFNINSNATQVTLSQVDLSGETVLSIIGSKPAGAVSVPVTFLKGGNTGLKVTVIGASGGTATATRSLFIDEASLTGQWQFAANQTLGRQVDTIPVLFSARLLSNTGLLSAVQLKRNDAAVATTGLTLRQVNDSLYQLIGLRAVSSTPGNYQLLFNLQQVKKWSSGISGNGVASVFWTVLNPNKAPVAAAGRDTTITQTGTVMLNGSASADPDGNLLTYRWIAPTGLKLNDSTLAKPSFTVTAANNGNTYSFLLIVSDGDLYATSTVNVTVRLCGTETCNGIDDDCDGLVDEGFQVTYYKDNDGDGFGSAATTTVASQCAPPPGYAPFAGDCDDSNAAVYPGADGDGCSTCTTDGVTFYSGVGQTFQWQVDNGTGFKNITDNAVYTGATQRYLQLKQPPTAWSGYKYRCVVTNNGIQSFSPVRVLKFTLSWKGTVNSAWENPANWSCNRVPDQYTDVKIGNTVPVVISSAASAKSVTVSANSKVTINKGAALNVKK